MKPTEERGFTLIEVLVATVILTVALVALAEMMAITLRMQMLGRNQTNAARLAQSKMDQLIGSVMNWDTAADIQIGGSLATSEANYNDAPEDGWIRRWVVTAGPVDPGSDAGDLRVVTIRVIPVVSDNRATATVELTTILRRQGT